MTKYHLHLGLTDLSRLDLAFLPRSTNGAAVYVDGDGWNEWGEPVGTSGNDETTLHVVVEVTADNHGAAYALFHPLAMRIREHLTVMDSGNIPGLVAAITLAEDWSDEDSLTIQRIYS